MDTRRFTSETAEELNRWMTKTEETKQRIPVCDLEFPPVSGFSMPGMLSPDQVNSLYQCVDSNSPFFGPETFVARLDRIKAEHRGNFPMPGWHAFMVTSRFLEYASWLYKEHPYYEKWFDIVFLPRPGTSMAYPVEENTKKALLPEQMKEQRQPRKKFISAKKQREKDYNMALFRKKERNPCQTITFCEVVDRMDSDDKLLNHPVFPEEHQDWSKQMRGKEGISPKILDPVDDQEYAENQPMDQILEVQEKMEEDLSASCAITRNPVFYSDRQYHHD